MVTLTSFYQHRPMFSVRCKVKIRIYYVNSLILNQSLTIENGNEKSKSISYSTLVSNTENTKEPPAISTHHRISPSAIYIHLAAVFLYQPQWHPIIIYVDALCATTTLSSPHSHLFHPQSYSTTTSTTIQSGLIECLWQLDSNQYERVTFVCPF